MFVTGDQLLAHLVGDYILQSDWMANEKTKSHVPAAAHALSYTLPFLFLTTSWQALLFMVVTHFVIDRWRLARYVCWAKNFLNPPTITETPYGDVWKWNAPWSECVATGYHKDRPAWLAVWLLIIADNTMHLICNAAALRWL